VSPRYLRQLIVCIERVKIWWCVFVIRCLWRFAIEVWSLITWQPHSLKAYEAKLCRPYKNTNKPVYMHFPSCILCSKLPSEQLNDGRRQTYYLVSFSSYRIVCNLLSFEQKEILYLWFLNTVRSLPYLVPNSDAIQCNSLNNWSEFEIFSQWQ